MPTYRVTQVSVVTAPNRRLASTYVNEWSMTGLQGYDVQFERESIRRAERYGWIKLVRDRLFGPKPVTQPAGKQSQS